MNTTAVDYRMGDRKGKQNWESSVVCMFYGTASYAAFFFYLDFIICQHSSFLGFQDQSGALQSMRAGERMPTTLVNVKVENIRPAFLDLRAWCSSSKHVYIGRRGVVFIDRVRFPDRDSVWANPFKVGKRCSREESIAKYEAYIRGWLAKEEGLRADLRALRGKVLGCWCKPLACHGNVLLRLLAEEEPTPDQPAAKKARGGGDVNGERGGGDADGDGTRTATAKAAT